MSFSIPAVALPEQATLVSPEGSLGRTNPTYTWNDVSGSIWYYLWVDGPPAMFTRNGTLQRMRSAMAVLVQIANATPSLAAGTYTWKVQTWNEAGFGPWSSGMNFSMSALGAATLVSPSGGITDSTPTYTWNAVDGATFYYLQVDKAPGPVIQVWYEASVVCNGGICSAKPTTPVLSAGAHAWSVQTWNSAGYGPWSAVMNFSLPGVTPPGGTTLVSPAGSLIEIPLTYIWNDVPAATWYYLKVSTSSSDVFKQWYTATQANCDGSICFVTDPIQLSSGTYTWSVQTWSSAGYGPWSSGMDFSMNLPGAATLVSPSGEITESTPTYTWNAVSGATWYYLKVNTPSDNVILEWYKASNVCNGSICSAIPTTALSIGTYTWSVQTWSNAGFGPWSGEMSFSLTVPAAAAAFEETWQENEPATATPMPTETLIPSETATPAVSDTPSAAATETAVPSPTPAPTETPVPTSTLTVTPASPTSAPTETAVPTSVSALTTSAAASVPAFVSASFVYDGDGRRVKATMNDTETTYFVGAHYEVTNGVVTKYYYAGSQRIAMRKDGNVSYLISDHLGSTSLVTDESGAVVSEMKYKAWGEVRSASGETATKYTYTGQYSHTDDFGLLFYNARWYDPYINHFTQPDSLVPNPSNPQAWDRYAYVLNNPIRYTDPSGHREYCDQGNGFGPNCTPTTSYWLDKINNNFSNVKIKNPADWMASEFKDTFSYPG